MSVTIDDLPVSQSNTHSTAEQAAITTQLCRTLKKHKVPAIGFVNESKLEVEGIIDPGRVALLEAWLEAGFDLGNHGYAHLDLHRVPTQTWMNDVLRGERVLRPLVERYGTSLRYFRHPYLHTGRSLEIREQTTAFLRDLGYEVAPVSIDNQEWVFARAYTQATDARDKHEIGEAYLRYMTDMVDYYERQADAIASGGFPQILLIHANQLNADWLDKLLTLIGQRGYRFISLEQALKHADYQSEDRFTGAGGITWLHRWAVTRKMPASVFAGEPDIPEWLKQYR